MKIIFKHMMLSLLIISSFGSIRGMRRQDMASPNQQKACIVFYRGPNWLEAATYHTTIQKVIDEKKKEASKKGFPIRVEYVDSNISVLAQAEETVLLAEVENLTRFIESISQQGFNKIHVFTYGEVGVNVTAMMSHMFAFNTMAQTVAGTLQQQQDLVIKQMTDLLANAFATGFLTASTSGVGNLVLNTLSYNGVRQGVQVKTHASDAALADLKKANDRVKQGASDLHDFVARRPIEFNNVHSVRHGTFQLPTSLSEPQSAVAQDVQARRFSQVTSTFGPCRIGDEATEPVAQGEDERESSPTPPPVMFSRPLPEDVQQPRSFLKKLAHSLTLHMFDSRAARVLAENVHVMVHVFRDARTFTLPPIPFHITDSVTMTEYELPVDDKVSVGCWMSFCTPDVQKLLMTSVKAAVGIVLQAIL